MRWDGLRRSPAGRPGLDGDRSFPAARAVARPPEK